ncbi:MAG: OsmC family protein [Gammaproteobacteria bacterium]|nr:OsmC family protein [Gammaproteobacteria bacterium]
MGELSMAYSGRCYSSGISGRSICNARHHHWVSDDSGGDAVGAGELFCAGLSACAVNLIERIARNEGRVVQSMDVSSSAWRDMDKPQADLTLYDAMRVRIEMWGVSDDDAEYLVKAWKSR